MAEHEHDMDWAARLGETLRHPVQAIQAWWAGQQTSPMIEGLQRLNQGLVRETALHRKIAAQADLGREHARDTVQGIGYGAAERAWVIESEGMVLGDKGNRLYTPGPMDRAPKRHPAWTDALRKDAERLRAMGEPVIDGRRWDATQPYEREDPAWPRQTSHAPAEARAQSKDEIQRMLQEQMRREALPLDARHAEHEARWAVVETKLTAMGQRLDAYFATHPFSVQQLHASLEHDRHAERRLETLHRDAVIQLLHSVSPELEEGYRHDPATWGQPPSRFDDPQSWPRALQRFEQLTPSRSEERVHDQREEHER